MSLPADPRVDTHRMRISYDGTPTPMKTALFLLVCAAWLLPGLAGHDPWKTDEAITLGAVAEMLRSGNWTLPTVAGEPYLERGPLYFWVAALLSRAFGGALPLHDAARLASGFFMAVTMTTVSVAAVTLHGPRAGRVAVLLLIGCIGLLIRAHEMSADLASLTGISMAVAGMALAGRSPWWGGPLFGLGIGTAFLADGFLPALQVVVLAAALPMAGPKWRTSAYALAMGVGVAVAVPLVVAWPAALVHQSPALAAEWLSQATTTRWSEGITRTTLGDTAYFARILPWYAWPALPLAAWTVWRARRTLKARTDLHLPLAGTVVFFVLLSVLADARDANALPLLIPLVLLGVAELDSLPRGAASALDWFGVTTFALMALVLWVGFVAVMTGSPAAAAAWIQREIPGYQYPFRFVPFALATLLTCLWIAVVARSIRTTRRAVVNWSAGITMVWMLTMMLGLPLIDQARSYRAVALQLASHAPPGKCVLAAGVGEAQHALLDYFAGIRLKPRDGPDAARCEMLLAQFSPGKTPIVDAAKWREEWRGSRPGDRNESLVLYRRVR